MHHHRFFVGRLVRDTFIIFASVVGAVLLVRLGIINAFIGESQFSLIFASFLSGAFFTSLFTVAPAGVALVAVAQSFNPFLVAFFGAIGAMLIDMLIISFVRKDIAANLDGLAKMTFKKHILHAFHFGFLKWIAFGAGIFLIVTPLPDELGLFLIGISKINHRFLPLAFFISHFIGILVIVFLASAI